eukprot:snap_masked-scaffold_3-processed-gene-17.18-mRNA-1 protein AED:1.00 eAED:1.00 QI:0/0/0/0/1/1/3/0/85
MNELLDNCPFSLCDEPWFHCGMLQNVILDCDILTNGILVPFRCSKAYYTPSYKYLASRFYFHSIRSKDQDQKMYLGELYYIILLS